MFLYVILATLTLSTFGIHAAPHDTPQESLDDWLEKQETIALEGILANIGPNGSRVSGASDGIVVASPSKSEPDYFYTWTRDAALIMKALIDRFIRTQDAQLEPYILSYIDSQYDLQTLVNPSGNVSTGGLGEPKFHVNMTPFNEDWGRPQLDGPALRLTAITTYANYLLDNDSELTVRDVLWPILDKDLQHIHENVNASGFDLWEEIKGKSFFTMTAQQRALLEAGLLQQALGVKCNKCFEQSAQLLDDLSDMWDSDAGYIRADDPDDDSVDRSGKGANTILATTLRSALVCDGAYFAPCSNRALANLKAVVDSMRHWPINSNATQSEAIAIGRYPEDVYYGGNPWFLTTCAAAEQLYYAVTAWDREGIINIDETSLRFFVGLYQNAVIGEYEKGSNTFELLSAAAREYADGFLKIVQTYTPEDGSMAEQFGKTDGEPLSAEHLTWSYSALLTAKAARDGHLPPTWGRIEGL